MYTYEKTEIGGIQAERLSHLMEDGTQCAILKPEENWNGTILLDLDGGGACMGGPMAMFSAPKIAMYLSLGYAYGGITREPVSYRFTEAVDRLLLVRDAFIQKFGVPKHTVVVGGSRGAFVGRIAMERYPDIFEGALVDSGGGGGEIAALNSKLDAKWCLNTLVKPERPLQLVNLDSLEAEEERLGELVALADSTPLGRARLALAAALEQFPAWALPTEPEPAEDDWDAQYQMQQACFQMAQFTLGTAMIEKIAGGVISWNHGVDYTELLERCGRKDFVLAMYEKAGVGVAGLEADLAELEKAPRIHANPEAVAKAEKDLSYTGKISGPVVNMDNIGDQIDPAPSKYAYRDTLRNAGTEDLLRVLWVRSAGHGNFNNAERAAALTTLMNRIETGQWGDTSPVVMNALAESIEFVKVELPPPPPGMPALFRGEDQERPRFMEYEPVGAMHNWDGSNWDSYK